MKSYSEAYDIIKNEFNLLKSEDEAVSLLDSAGRMLTGDIYSNIELPSFNNSAMDGICIKFSESTKSWNIIGELSAGNFHDVQIGSGESVLIMTGGKIPKGGDTVIPVEDINISGSKAVLKSNSSIKHGQNIRKAGQDLKKGELIAPAGITIRPVNISLLAACGIDKVKVKSKLKFGIMATGDELVDISEIPVNDKIRASNLYALVSLVKNLSMDFTNYGIVKDDKFVLKEKIEFAINEGSDIILTSGGVSAGKFDLMQEVLSDLGFESIFCKVNIKPGKPLLFAKITQAGKTILLFGLPGNPVSAFVTFHLFVRDPILEIMSGLKQETQTAFLKDKICKSDRKTHFVRGIIEFDRTNGRNTVMPSVNQSSSNMSGLSRSNALIVVGENMIDPEKGASVECIMI